MSQREDHEARADAADDVLGEMEERSERLEDEIEGTREDWEQKKRDPKVPGAAGSPEEAEGPEPEAEYPTKGASDDEARDEGDGGGDEADEPGEDDR